MGCDIHLRVEYLAPSETLNQELKVVPEGPPEWTPAEKLVPKNDSEDAKRFFWKDGKLVDDEEWSQVPDLYLAYEDVWYHGRDYGLFGALSGTRGGGQIWEERGFPDDASDHVREDYEGWGFDGHTPSWQTLDELLAVDWSATLAEPGYNNCENPEWGEMLERMKDLAFARCDGNQTRVRIVYWYDN